MIGKLSVRILRGAKWGECLESELRDFSGTETQWMEQRTSPLKHEVDSWVGLLQLQGKLCYLKLLKPKSLGQSLLFRAGYSRACKSYDRAQDLLHRGISVPVPLCCLLLPSGIMLLTEGIANGTDLQVLWSESLDDKHRDLLMTRAGAILANLHRAGYCHGDFKWNNLFWAADKFYLVDLEGVERAGLDSGRQVKDLARFVLNAEECSVSPKRFDLFLSSYLEGSGKTRREVLKSIMPKLRRLRARHRLKYGQRGQQILGEK